MLTKSSSAYASGGQKVSKQKKAEGTDKLAALLQDLLIVELARAGITQPQIREIVGVDMWRVSRIARHINRGKK